MVLLEKKQRRMLARGERRVMMEKIQTAKNHPETALMVTMDYTKSVFLPHFRHPNNPVVSSKLLFATLLIFLILRQVGNMVQLPPIQIGGLINYSTGQKRLFFHPPSGQRSQSDCHTVIL